MNEKEQLLDELKETSDENKKLHQGWIAQGEVIEKLRKENEQLKNNIELMSKYNGENMDDVIKLRKALEEIREIAKKEASHYDRLIEIVTKVGEVLDEN